MIKKYVNRWIQKAAFIPLEKIGVIISRLSIVLVLVSLTVMITLLVVPLEFQDGKKIDDEPLGMLLLRLKANIQKE